MKGYPSERAFTAEYAVTGGNAAVFLNRISRAGVKILAARPSGNAVILTIPSADCKKLFAICREMCYNIISDGKNPPENVRKNRVTLTERKRGGFMRPFVKTARRFGLIAGAAAFIVCAAAFDDRILGYTLAGVPAASRSGVVRSLEENGAAILAKFSGTDLSALSSAIVGDNADISFAAVKKRGSFLVVETLPAVFPQVFPPTDVLSAVDGEIEKITVLRGTALVKKGDKVKKGQALVGAYFTAGESTVKTVPLAEIYVKAQFYFTFNASGCGEYFTSAAVAVAKEKCPESNIIAQNVEILEENGGYRITVTLTYVKKFGG